jgi:hypothetical protein
VFGIGASAAAALPPRRSNSAGVAFGDMGLGTISAPQPAATRHITLSFASGNDG